MRNDHDGTSAATAREPLEHDDIAQVAYGIFLARQESGQPGSPESDWFQAIAELSGE